MKDIIRNNAYFLLGFILALSTLWPMVAAPYFTHHDNVQIIRLHEMDECFKDLQIPCRWVPNLGNLYGYPLFNYYAPFPYYFGELSYYLTKSLTVAVKIMFTTALVGSYVFMYLLASKLWGKAGGMISATFYIFAPYHAVVLYVRGAMAELWGLMFLPSLIWSLLLLREKTKILYSILFGIFIFLTITSHNLSAMIYLPAVAALVVIFLLQSYDFRFAKLSFLSLILGLSLASFYWLPMIVEKDLVYADSTTWGYFSYTEHFKGLRKLFLDQSWGFGQSVREIPGGEKDGMSFQVGWIHSLLWIASMFAGIKLWGINRKFSSVLLLISFVILILIFMVHPRSWYVWQLVPHLRYLQFPWRLLGPISFLTSLSAGSIILLMGDKFKNKATVILILAVILANFFYFKPEKFLNLSDSELLSGYHWERQIKRAILDYLPKSAQEPPAELASSRYQILTGSSEVSDFKEGTNWITFRVNSKSHTIIRLSKYYFPNWKVFVDGKEIKIDYENNLGLITFILGVGNHQIKAKLNDTPIRTFSNLITILGFGLLCILLLTQLPRVRSWVLYYLKALNR